jgi:hypothetical protein
VQAPAVQVSATFGSHTVHDEPLAPHAVAEATVQTPPRQQPVGHVVAEHPAASPASSPASEEASDTASDSASASAAPSTLPSSPVASAASSPLAPSSPAPSPWGASPGAPSLSPLGASPPAPPVSASAGGCSTEVESDPPHPLASMARHSAQAVATRILVM